MEVLEDKIVPSVTAVDQYYTVVTGNTIDVQAPGVLTNDTTTAPPLSASMVSGPSYGTAVIIGSTGRMQYTSTAGSTNANGTLNLGFVGTDSLVYQATDADGESAQGTVYIDVTDVAPTVSTQTLIYSVTENNRDYVSTADGVLDASGAYAPDGEKLLTVIPDSPGSDTYWSPINDAPYQTSEGGTLALTNWNGAFEYTPPTNFTGWDSFTFSAWDGSEIGFSPLVTVYFDVGGAAVPTSTTLSSSPASTTYGDSVALTATVASTVPGEGTPSSGTVTFYDGSTAIGSGAVNSSGIATLTTSSLPAGSDSLTAVYSGVSNFASSNSSPMTETVSPAPLTIAANDETMTYGAGSNFNGYTVSGLVGSDSVDSVGLSTCAWISESGNWDVGTWGIWPSDATGSGLSNYSITYQYGTLTVTPLALTLSGFTVANKPYDGTTSATVLNDGVLTGTLSGDDVFLDDTNASAVFASPEIGTSIAVTASGYALFGADAGNYAITQPTTTANITTAGVTWDWIASSPGNDDDLYDWSVNGSTPTSLPSSWAQVDIVVEPGSAALELESDAAVVDSIQTPSGWNNVITCDNGLEITGANISTSTLNDTTLNVNNASFTVDSGCDLEIYNVVANAPQAQTIKGEEFVRGEVGGNFSSATGPLTIDGGKLSILGGNGGPASYTAALGISVLNEGKLWVNGGNAEQNGTLDAYTLSASNSTITVASYTTVNVTGTLEGGTGDQNFPNPSMTLTSGSLLYLSGTSCNFSTEYGIYAAARGPKEINSQIFLQPAQGATITLNGDVYTYGKVVIRGGGSISTNGYVTFNNATLLDQAAGTPAAFSTWTCSDFIGTGTTGVTVDATVSNPGATTTYKLIVTTGGANSATGTVTSGDLNGVAFPPSWTLTLGNSKQELDLVFTKP